MKILKNYILYLLYQISLMLLPLVTIPYITRVLGSEGIGTYAFVDSLANIFLIVGSLGVFRYGKREIAYVRDSFEQRSRVFWEIFLFRVISFSLTLLVYLLYVLFMVKSNKIIYLIFSFTIINYAIGNSWLFSGMEDFQKWVSRSFIVKIVCVACVFLFVKTSADLWKYCFIYGFSDFLSALVLWLYTPKYIKFVKVGIKDALKHFKPICALFIPQMSNSFYFILDRFLLGILASVAEVSFYALSLRVVKITTTLVTSLSFVTQPRVSNIFAKGDMEKIKDYTYKTFDFSSFLAIPIGLGIFAIAPEFVPWFFGKEFFKIIPVISIISIVAIPMAWASILGEQLMVSIKKEKEYSISLVIAAAACIITNLALIPLYKSVGSGIALVVSLTLLVISQIYMLRDFLSIKKLFKNTWQHLTASVIFMVIDRIIGIHMGIGCITTMVQFFAGFTIYMLVLYIMKCETIYLIFDKLKELAERYLVDFEIGKNES